ncbi:MAG: OsmC family protein [Spirochaetota bacterium]
MKIQVKRKNKAVWFEAKTENGNIVEMDGSPDFGGENAGARPMELLLIGLAGCSSIDVVSILKKQRQNLEDIQVKVKAERVDEIPAVFSKIHVSFYLYGEIDENKAQTAVSLSMDKYCSVSKMLAKTATISYEVVLNPKE